MSEKNEIETNQKSLIDQTENPDSKCWIKPGERLKAGITCPRCSSAILAYNGLLQLTCPECGLTEAGACT